MTPPYSFDRFLAPETAFSPLASTAFDSATDGLLIKVPIPTLGRHTLTWLDAPHLPHSWECGYLFDERSRTLLCGDLLTPPGSRPPAVTESDADVWEPSEGMRKAFSCYADLRNPASLIERLAATEPELLACMHGSSYRGKGAPLLRRLSESLSAE